MAIFLVDSILFHIFAPLERDQCCCSSGVEHFLGKEEVVSSILINSSTKGRDFSLPFLFIHACISSHSIYNYSSKLFTITDKSDSIILVVKKLFYAILRVKQSKSQSKYNYSNTILTTPNKKYHNKKKMSYKKKLIQK